MSLSPARTAAAVTAAGLLVALTGCGASDDQGSATGAKLTMYAHSSSPAEDETLKKAIDSYNKRGRNTVSLKILPEYDTALQTALAGGEPPDVFYLNDNKLPDMAKNGVLEPVGDKIDNPDDIYPSLRESFTYDGVHYCPAKDFSTLQLVYDTEAFDKAGVEPPTTWDELAAVAKKLSEKDRPALSFNPEFYRWGVFLAQAGAWPTDDDVSRMTMDDPKMRTALEHVAKLHADGQAATPQQLGVNWGGEALGKGKAAMTIEGNWVVGAMETDFPDVKYAVAELPAGPAGKATMAFSVCYGVAAASKHKAAAIDLVTYLTSPEQQLAFTKEFPVMPSRQSLAEAWLAEKPELKAFVAGADYAKKSVFVPGFPTVIDTFNDGIQGLAKGNKKTDEVITTTQKAGEDVLGG
ncbi:MAG: extracellular solute-binding protein [Micromonosporaceae bacterium]|nr:extracellular solute-binding protein [Micromonosporaceae bacterium]